MKSTYREIEEIVKEKGKKFVDSSALPIYPKSFWVIKNRDKELVVGIDENPQTEEDRIVVIIDNTGEEPRILYSSPASKRGGAKEVFALLGRQELSEETFSEERLIEILKELKGE